VSAEALIAIIDDDESLCTALVSLIFSIGYSACGFTSAEEFLQSGVIGNVACIIVDVQMSGMSGIDLMLHLLKCGYLTPVIMITARTEPVLEERAMASGAAFFLKKPLNISLLIDYLEKTLKPEFR
jgi:FixJ family two-component response regulator